MKRALVLGLGHSGLAMARWLAREGWQVRVADTRQDPPMGSALRRELPEAELRTGALETSALEGVELLAISPGLAPRRPPAAPLVDAARRARVPLAGEIELFAQALARLRQERGYQPRLIGVTGTNGKTTTTSLAGKMARAALALVRAIGCALGPSLQALREYGGEPHRTERVATVDAVEYYDDSKGTNVGATLAAIQGLASESRKLVVILGGDGKQQRFEPLAGAVAAHARAVVLIGRDGPRIEQALQAGGVPPDLPIVTAATLH